MTDRDLMQQALEALESDPISHAGLVNRKQAITALRERLAQPEQKPVRFNCTVIDDAHLNGVPLSQWGKQHEMQPCAGRNCGSTNPNLHSAECFEDYEKSTGMNQWQGLTDEEINSVRHNRDWTAHWTDATFARAIEAKLREKNHG